MNPNPASPEFSTIDANHTAFGIGTVAYLNSRAPFDGFSDLPEDIQTYINLHADQFRTSEDIRRAVEIQQMKS